MNAFENHMKRIESALRKMELHGDHHIKIYTGEIRRELSQLIKTFGEELSFLKKDLLLLDKNVKDIFASADLEEVILRNKLDQFMYLIEN